MQNLANVIYYNRYIVVYAGDGIIIIINVRTGLCACPCVCVCERACVLATYILHNIYGGDRLS